MYRMHSRKSLVQKILFWAYSPPNTFCVVAAIEEALNAIFTYIQRHQPIFYHLLK
jgi:hypothetical protein